MNFKKIITLFSLLLISGLIVYGYILYRDIFGANTKFNENEVFVYIPTESDYEALKKIVSPYIQDMERFEMVANKKSYPERTEKAGRFLLKKGMNSNEIVNALRINVPVNLAFNNQERLENFAGRIGSQIEADSLSLLTAFKDKKFLEENGFTEENVLSI